MTRQHYDQLLEWLKHGHMIAQVHAKLEGSKIVLTMRRVSDGEPLTLTMALDELPKGEG
jgi:hypothetical protein